MSEVSCCGSKGPTRIIVACSGAADVGEIADRVGRTLARSGAGRMACLAGVGGRVPFVLQGLPENASLLAIDGCPEDCAKRTLELAGIPVACHVRVTDCGLAKGRSPSTEHAVAAVVARARECGPTV